MALCITACSLGIPVKRVPQRGGGPCLFNLLGRYRHVLKCLQERFRVIVSSHALGDETTQLFQGFLWFLAAEVFCQLVLLLCYGPLGLCLLQLQPCCLLLPVRLSLDYLKQQVLKPLSFLSFLTDVSPLAIPRFLKLEGDHSCTLGAAPNPGEWSPQTPWCPLDVLLVKLLFNV